MGTVINYFRREPLPLSWLVCLWHGALRGAGAYAFTLVFPSPHRAILMDATCGVIIFTVVLLGSTSIPLMKLLGVDRSHGEGGHGGGGEVTAHHAPLAAAPVENAFGAAVDGGGAFSDPPLNWAAGGDGSSSSPASYFSSGDSRASTDADGSSRGGSLSDPSDEGHAGHDGIFPPHAALVMSGGRAFRVMVVGGARVYTPVDPLPRLSTAVSIINRWDSKLRWWISGVRRE